MFRVKRIMILSCVDEPIKHLTINIQQISDCSFLRLRNVAVDLADDIICRDREAIKIKYSY